MPADEESPPQARVQKEGFVYGKGINARKKKKKKGSSSE